MTLPAKKSEFDWLTSQASGRVGVELAIDLLRFLRLPSSWYQTVGISDASNNPVVQKLGIDLLWLIRVATCTCAITVEVKTDRHFQTGNFFFETVSNVAKQSPGAFLASTAELCFYVFPKIETIHCIPLFDAREWFLANLEQFPEKAVSSNHAGRIWHTKGKLVPIPLLLQSVEGVKTFVKTGETWNEAREQL